VAADVRKSWGSEPGFAIGDFFCSMKTGAPAVRIGDHPPQDRHPDVVLAARYVKVQVSR